MSRSSFQKVYLCQEGFLVKKFLFSRKLTTCQEGLPCPQVQKSSPCQKLFPKSFPKKFSLAKKFHPCPEVLSRKFPLVKKVSLSRSFHILESLPLAKNVFLFPRFKSFPHVQKFFPKSFPSPEVPIFQKVSHL
jgi:hypothetical protein